MAGLSIGTDYFSVNSLQTGSYLRSFMASLEDGFDFDFSKTDRMFVENTGPTPADDHGEAVGLALDSRLWGGKTLEQVLESQPDTLNGAGAFSSASGWVVASGWEISGGKAVATGATSELTIVPNTQFIEGDLYYVELTISDYLSGSLQVQLGGPGGTNYTAISSGGTFKFYGIPAGLLTSASIRLRGVSAFSGSVDNLTVRRVPGHIASQASSSLKPLVNVDPDIDLSGQPELVTNGGFNADLSGWETPHGTSAWISGRARITSGVGASSGRIAQPISCVVGKLYSVTVTGYAGTGGNPRLYVNTVTSPTNALIAEQFTPGTITRYFVATATTMYIMGWAPGTAEGDFAEFDGFSVKEVPSTYRRVLTSDGVDDSLLTDYFAGSGENFIVALVDVPAVGGGIITGMRNAANTRAYISIRGDGRVGGGVGGQGDGDIYGGADRRNQTAVIALAFDASSVRLFSESALLYEAPKVGVHATDIPFRIGAFNDNGNATNVSTCHIKRIIAGKGNGAFLDLATFRKISQELLSE